MLLLVFGVLTLPKECLWIAAEWWDRLWVKGRRGEGIWSDIILNWETFYQYINFSYCWQNTL